MPGTAAGRIAADAARLVAHHATTLLAVSAIALVPIYALDYFDGIRAGAFDRVAPGGPAHHLMIGLPNLATFAKYAVSLVLAPLQALAAIAALAQVRVTGDTSIASAYRAALPRFRAAVGTGFRYSTPLAVGFFVMLIGLGVSLLRGAIGVAGLVVAAAGLAAFSVSGFALTLALVHLVVDGRNPGHWFAVVRRVLARRDLRAPTLAVVALFPISLGCAIALDQGAAYVAAVEFHSRLAYEAMRLTIMASFSAFGNAVTFAYDEELRARGETPESASAAKG